ncbi:hypothetical protein [Thermodesulfovibrio hydrogeniphilus]
MFKNLTIGKKFYIAFGVVLFLMIAVSAFTVLQLYGIVNNTSELKERIDKIDSAATISDIARLGGELNSAIGRFRV